MEEVPKIVTERLRAVKPEAHLDVNLLAAFAEKSLTSREQAQVLEHLAGCALCRDVVAHAHPEPAMQQVAAAPAKKRQPWFRASALRWGALAACVAIVGTLVIGRSSRSKVAPSVETAAKREVTIEAKLEPAAPPPSPASESSRVTSADKKATQPAPGTRAESDANQFAWTTSNSTVNRIGGAQNEKRQASAGLSTTQGRGIGGLIPGASGDAVSPAKRADQARNLDEGVAHGGPLTRDRQDARAFDRLDSFTKLQPGAAAPGSTNGAQSAAMDGISGNKPASPTPKGDLALVLPPSLQSAPKLADKESAAQPTTVASARKAPNPATEALQEEALAPAVAPPPPPTPAKIESAAVGQLPLEGRNITKLPEQQKQTSENNSGVLFKSKDTDAYAGREINGAMRTGFRLPLPRWQISAEGKLLRSNDAGDTWQQVPVADNVVFRVLSVAGSQLWIGGAQGNLFHSADSGGHWEQVKPAASGKTLSSDITGIEFPDPQHGKLSTADRQIWTTTDGGLSWQQQ